MKVPGTEVATQRMSKTSTYLWHAKSTLIALSPGDTGDSSEPGDPSWLALDPESSALSTITLGLLKQALQQRSFLPPGFVTM